MKHLPIKSLGKLLSLAESASREEATSGPKTCAEAIDRIRRRIAQPEFDTGSARLNIELFLSALSREERSDIAALCAIGDRKLETFEFAWRYHGHADSDIPFLFSRKIDLHDSLIRGLKRFGESHANTAGDTGDAAA
jgi:hypothetical protein